MKLLLTGATGFVGRNLLLKALQEKRYDEIWITVRNPEKLRRQLQADGFEAVPSSIKVIETAAPQWDLSKLPAVDHVVHAAGILFGLSRDEYFETHVQGTLVLFAQLPATASTVVLSSQAASGPTPGTEGEKKEGDGDAPLTWYGQSKLEMERQLAARFPRANYLCLRPPMVLGPRDQATLPLFKMVSGRLRFKPGLRPKWYSVIAVADLVQAIFVALDRAAEWPGLSHRGFFVSSGIPVSDRELISTAALASHRRRGWIVSLPQPALRGLVWLLDAVPAWRMKIPTLSADRSREIWPDRWVISPGAFQKVFDWKAQEELAATLRQTYDWYVRSGELRA